jgi:hypothetical protein
LGYTSFSAEHLALPYAGEVQVVGNVVVVVAVVSWFVVVYGVMGLELVRRHLKAVHGADTILPPVRRVQPLDQPTKAPDSFKMSTKVIHSLKCCTTPTFVFFLRGMYFVMTFKCILCFKS